MLPEPLKPLPPTDLNDSLTPLTATHPPPMNFVHSLAESEPRPFVVWTIAPRMRHIYQTQSNSFGLFRRYDNKTLPVYDPEDISDDIVGSQSTITQQVVTTHQVSHTENLFHPYPNEVSLCLGDWYWNQGGVKSKDVGAIPALHREMLVSSSPVVV